MSAGIAVYTRERQLSHARAWTPADEASLRAAYGRTEWAKRKTFEEAMAIPAMATGIRQMARSLRNTAGELFTEPDKEPT